MKHETKISCYFERNDGYILAVVHRTANFISIEIADQFSLPHTVGYDPFFDRRRWLLQLTEQQERLHNKPIAEALLDQQMFNGVGNWMRAEILHLAGILPFEPLAAVINSEPQLSRLVSAMDTVLHRTLVLMEKGFDINSSSQQHAFKASLLVYGKGQRLVYTKIGNKRESKALWVASTLNNWGSLASNYDIVTT